MESRPDMNDFIDSLDWEKDLEDHPNKPSMGYADLLSLGSTRTNDPYKLMNPQSYSSPTEPKAMEYPGLGFTGRNESQRHHLMNSAKDSEGLNDFSGQQEGHLNYYPKTEILNQNGGNMQLNDPLWLNSVGDEGFGQSSTEISSDIRSANSHLGDPVINIVAPEESTHSMRGFGGEAYPMYSVDGAPIHGSHMPEFQNIKQEPEDGSVPHPVSPALASPLTPVGSQMTSPFGTPQMSPSNILGSPSNATDGGDLVTTPFGSPLNGDGPRSPYEVPYSDFSEGALSPLVDGDDQYVENSIPSTYLSRNNSLGVPSARRKSRALSDAWIPEERDAFIFSLDAQAQAARSPINRDYQQNGYGGPVGADNLMPEAVSQIQFPSYTPVNVRPPPSHGRMNSTSADCRVTSSNSSANSSIDVSPNDAVGSHHVQHDQFFHGSHNLSHLGVPMNGRARSHSSPYEHTNDLKSSQMFSCELCGKRFTRAYNLRSHMRTHTDERPFECQHCGKAFARQHDRKRHEALHSGEKRFACYGLTHGFQWGCRKRFARADALGRHFRTEAGKNCLRPLIDRICNNGNTKESAPEGIVFEGFADNQPQLLFSVSERDPARSLTSEEREELTRRTVILTAVSEQFQELIEGSSRYPDGHHDFKVESI